MAQQSNQVASDIGDVIINGEYNINEDAFFDMIRTSGIDGSINLDAAEQWGYQLLAEGTSSSTSWGKFILDEVYNQQIKNLATQNLNSFAGRLIDGALVASSVTGVAGAVRGIASGSIKSGLKKIFTRKTLERNLTQDILKLKRLKGNSDILAGTRQEAEALGKSWVNGKNVVKQKLDGGGFILKDGNRTFRLQFKPRSGIWQANFQENTISATGQISQIKNVHMNITNL